MSEVVPLLDAEGTFATVGEAFGLDGDTAWNARFHAFLVRVAGAVVVVDTGVGPPGGRDPFLPERQGWLPDALARARTSPEDVDLVVLTHLHVDHVGWNMLDGAPYFPNARYVAHRDDFDWVTRTRGDRPYVEENVRGLAATGRLELVEGPVEPTSGVRMIRIGGHTPGHSIIELDDATLVGDLAVHELQLARPAVGYVAEEDQATIAEQRRRLLPGFAASGRLVGFAHLGLGRVVRSGDGFAFTPLD